MPVCLPNLPREEVACRCGTLPFAMLTLPSLALSSSAQQDSTSHSKHLLCIPWGEAFLPCSPRHP